VTQPYRGDLESLHARIATLERAVRDHSCEACAARTLRRRRRLRNVVAGGLGVVLWVGLFLAYACRSAYLR